MANELDHLFRQDKTLLGFKNANVKFVTSELMNFIEENFDDSEELTSQKFKESFIDNLRQNATKEESLTKEEFKEMLEDTRMTTIYSSAKNYNELKIAYDSGAWKPNETKNFIFEDLPSQNLTAIIKTTEKIFDLPNFAEAIKKMLS
jgi:hypothetical protein